MQRSSTMHRTLERQLRRLGLTADGPPDCAAWARLLQVVSSAYQGADDDRYTLERSIEISSAEMRALHDELSAQAYHDALTGMPNRLALLEQLSSALAVARHHGDRVAVLFIDLDGFKLINDRLGHAGGDELLVRAAERIVGAVREEDVVARLGGDEFVVFCATGADPQDATRVGERIVQALQAPFRIQGENRFVSASIGIAISGGAADTSEQLLSQADLAMYRAKERGRGLVVRFDATMQALADDRAELESDLRQAMESNQFELHYQPVLELSSGAVLSYEALIRWNRPGHGLVGPDAFVPIAERARLMSAIGRWVVAEACGQAARWPDPGIAVGVNMSASELASDQVIASVTAGLQSSGLAASRLTIELTESAVLSDKQSVTDNLARLRRLGVTVALDDFGTGYSSLSHLQEIPATVLKIDRSFIAAIDRAGPAHSIIAAIVTMAHALDLTVIAEGVERPAQLDRLRELGCDAAQGYLFARPQPASQLPHRLAGLGAAAA